MANAIRQLNMAYNPVEDRLLLKISSGRDETLTEYRIWLTRRFVHILWNALEKVLDKDPSLYERVSPDNINAVKEFQEQAAISRADFKTPYQAKTAATPLGPEPILVSRLQVRKASSGGHVLSLQTAEGRSINLALQVQLIHSIRKLLADAVAKTGWNLSLGPSKSAEKASGVVPPRGLNS